MDDMAAANTGRQGASFVLQSHGFAGLKTERRSGQGGP